MSEPSVSLSHRSEPTVDIDCVSDETALLFAQGSLRGEELARVELHADRCSRCRWLLFDAAHAIWLEEHDSLPKSTSTGTFQVGQTIAGRYAIRRYLARGGMGEVYEAHDNILQETVALKTIAPELADDPQVIKNLVSEVRFARQVSHQNVCRIYDLGRTKLEGSQGSCYFLTMEFVPGISLRDRLKQRRLTAAEAEPLFHQLLLGLHAVHSLGIVHRDLKADNVMLRENESEPQRSAVLMDFGLASAVDPVSRQLSQRSLRLAGTLPYMAPEQLEGHAAKQATDIYAFGVVMFEVLTGEMPFVGKTAVAAALQRLSTPPRRPRDINPEISLQWQEVILRCLERQPNQRYASALDVLAALTPQRVKPEGIGVLPVETARRSAYGYLLTTAAALAAGLAAGSWLTAGSPSNTRGNELAAGASVDEPAQQFTTTTSALSEVNAPSAPNSSQGSARSPEEDVVRVSREPLPQGHTASGGKGQVQPASPIAVKGSTPDGARSTARTRAPRKLSANRARVPRKPEASKIPSQPLTHAQHELSQEHDTSEPVSSMTPKTSAPTRGSLVNVDF